MSSTSSRYAALAGCALLLSLACAHHDPVTAPTPVVDEIPELQSALAGTGFITSDRFTTGTVFLSDPGPPGDPHACAFRRVEHRRDTVSGWTLSEPGPDGRPLRALRNYCFYVKSSFQLLVTDATGAKVWITKPRGDEDLDREFLLRRETSASPWHLDTLTVGLQLNDDKLACSNCHTELVSVRITAPGLDTLLVQPNYLIPFPGLPQVPLGVPIHVEATSTVANDLVFVDNGGEWTRLDSTGPHSFAGDVFPHAGLTALAVQAITDSSLVTVGEHYSEFTFIFEYVGGAAAPRLGLRASR